MQVLTAKTKSCPRTVSTRYGEKSVIDIVVEGKDTAIWRTANDPTLMSLKSGQNVTVVKDANGKINLIDSVPTAIEPVTTATVSTAKTANDYSLDKDTKRAIASYISQQKDLLQFCWQQAETVEGPQTEDSIEKLAVTLYLSAQRKFGLA